MGFPYKENPYIAFLKCLAFVNTFQPHNRLMGQITAVALYLYLKKLRHREVGNLPEITQPETSRADIQTWVISLQNS